MADSEWTRPRGRVRADAGRRTNPKAMPVASARVRVTIRRRSWPVIRGWQIRNRSSGSLLAAVALSGTLLPLNSTMLAVALPDIADGVGGGVAASTWLVTMYVLVMAVLGPFAGRLGDRHGRRRMVLLGLGAFGAAS